jgi:hypothetical protein
MADDGEGSSSAAAGGRVLPSAPYLALIGRLCSDQICSEPFLIGSRAILCPSNVAPSRLQLWTNNNVRINGIRSVRRYSGTVGGFTVAVSSESGTACRTSPGNSSRSSAAQALAAGQTLRGPDLNVSSSQAWWKPFFVPLDRPLRVRAWGSIRSRGQRSTNPTGVPPTAAAETDSESLPDKATANLAEPRLPYQALIGRVCGSEQCGPVFLVGSDHTICPTSAFDDHLELWINHRVDARGRLGGTLPVTSDMFELQTRQGEYRFEISGAPDAACRNTGQ